MIQVYQAQFHDPPRSVGDCARACVASILEFPLTALPAPEPGDPEESYRNNWTAIGLFLKARGLYLLEVPFPIAGYTQGIHRGLWIAGGVAEGSGLPHFCVYEGCPPNPFDGGSAKRRHDPNPHGLGLSKLEAGIWIIPADPVSLHPGRMISP